MPAPIKTSLDHFTYPIAGESADRPKGLSWREAGFQFFDQELQRQLTWNGEAWVTAEGEPADSPRKAGLDFSGPIDRLAMAQGQVTAQVQSLTEANAALVARLEALEAAKVEPSPVPDPTPAPETPAEPAA